MPRKSRTTGEPVQAAAKRKRAKSEVVGSGSKRQKFGGRVKGTPNKLTRDLKEAIMNAFEKVGGEDYLVWLARAEPRAFATLVGKVLPLTIAGDKDAPMAIQVSWAA
jgi:hypothetical protein